ncbi:MAG: Ig-like domain-containing protein [Gammaproteobacteria bacterium]
MIRNVANSGSKAVRVVHVAAIALLLVGCGSGGSTSTDSASTTTTAPDATPVTATLPPPQRANQTPIATNDEISAGTGGALNIAVLDNDSDPDGDALVLTDVGVPTAGTASIDDAGTPLDGSDDRVRLSVPENFVGSIMVSYGVEDPSGARSEAFLMIDVAADSSSAVVNASPIAVDDMALTQPGQAITIAVLDNDSDPDGEAVALLAYSSPASGSLLRVYDELLYTPAPGFSGLDQFDYTISDGRERATAKVDVTVRAVVVQSPQQICGRVMIGPVVGADVRFFTVDDGGMAGTVAVAQATTDNNGQWCVALDPTRPDYLIQSVGGRYFDPADSGTASQGLRQIELGDGLLEGVLLADQNTATLSPLSSALLRKARRESFGTDFAQVFSAIRSNAQAAFGFDPFVTLADNPLFPTRDIGSTRDYAMLLGGTASALNRAAVGLAQVVPTAPTLDAFVRDLSDCQLDALEDGVAIEVALPDASRVLTTNVNLNLEILRFRNNQFDAYEGSDLVQVDASACAQSAVVPDVNGPQFIALPDDIVVSDPLDEGVLIDDGRLQPFKDSARAIDARPGAVTITLRGEGGAVLPNRLPVGETRVEFLAVDAVGNATVSAVRSIFVTTSMPPLASDDVATTNEDQPVDVPVLDNDVSVSQPLAPESISIESISGPATASVLGSAGVIRVVPNPNASGIATLTYTVANSDGLRSATATVSVTIVPLDDDAPVAVNDSASVAENASVSVRVLANDTDADALGLTGATVEVLEAPTNGSAIVDGPTQTIVYTPTPDFDGADSFRYQVRDRTGLTSNAAIVSIAVAGINQPPLLNDLVLSTVQDAAVAAPLVATDSDDAVDFGAFELVVAPTMGVVVATGETLTYTPDTGANGIDTFRFRVADARGALSNTAEATVTVIATAPNLPPIASDVSVTIDEDIATDIPLPASDPEGALDATSFVIVSPPTNGTLTGGVDAVQRYTPDLNFFGVDAFSFRVADQSGDWSNTATISVIVTPRNDAPQLLADAATTLERTAVVIDVLANDSDVDSAINPASVSVVTLPLQGTVTVDANGRLVYTSTGQFFGDDVLSYQVADTDGDFGAATTVTVNVEFVDDAPVSVDDREVVLAGTTARIDVLGNDTDPDTALAADSVTIVSGPQEMASVDPASGEILYTSVATFAGSDPLTYTVSDAAGNVSPIATLTVDVWPADDPDFDGVGRDIELEVGTDPDVADDVVVFIDSTTSAAGSDGTSWDTAFVSLAAASNAGVLVETPGATTFVLMAQNPSVADTSTDWQLDLNNNCDDMVIVGSVGYLISVPEPDADGDWSTRLIGTPGQRPLTLQDCANANLYGLRITGGSGVTSGGGARVAASSATFHDIAFANNEATEQGGALALEAGASLTLIDGLFSRNRVSAVDGVDGRGGAVHLSALTTATITGTRFTENRIVQAGAAGVSGGGGALFIDDANVMAGEATFSGNQSDTVGGAISARDATGVMDLRNLTISGNEAAVAGGGIWASDTRANLEVRNVILSGNYAQTGGGAYTDDAQGSVFSNISAAYNLANEGGAIWVAAGSARFDDNIVIDNRAITSADSIGGTAGTLINLDANNNVVDTAWAGFFGTNNITADPLLTRGFYLSHTPGSVSPAIDHSQTFQSDDAAVALSTRFTDADGSGPDTGALDAGFHYATDSAVVVDEIEITSFEIDPAGLRHILRFQPRSGGVAVGPGRRLFGSAELGVAQVRLHRYTDEVVDPLGSGASTAARDLGNGTYEMYLTAPIDTEFFLDLWIDTLVGPRLVRYLLQIEST